MFTPPREAFGLLNLDHKDTNSQNKEKRVLGTKKVYIKKTALKTGAD